MAKAKENERKLVKKLEKAQKEMDALRKKLHQVNEKLGQKEELEHQPTIFRQRVAISKQGFETKLFVYGPLQMLLQSLKFREHLS